MVLAILILVSANVQMDFTVRIAAARPVLSIMDGHAISMDSVYIQISMLV